MKFCHIMKIMFQIMAVQGLQRIDHILQEAIVKSQLQPARCLLNFDLLTLKQSCLLCDQITSSIHFQSIAIKAACYNLARSQCCWKYFRLRYNVALARTEESVKPWFYMFTWHWRCLWYCYKSASLFLVFKTKVL